MLLLYALITAVGLSAAPTDPTKGRFEYDPADETVTAIMIGNENCYDPHVVTVSSATGGLSASAEQLWLTWLEFEPGKGDRIWVGSRDLNAKDFVSRTCITPEVGIYKNPTLTADKTGGFWLTYEKQDGEKWSVAALRLDDKGQIRARSASEGSASSQPESPLTIGLGINHRIAAAPDAGAWVVWQAPKDGQFDIMAARLTDKGVADREVVGNLLFASNNWQPDVAVLPNGDVRVIWDACEDLDSSFDIYSCTRTNGTWRSGHVVAAEKGFEARARIVADPSGRAWAAWEQGNENWGKRYISRMYRYDPKYLQVADANGPLHAFRRLSVVGLEGTGVDFIEPSFPMPAMDKLTKRSNAPDGVVQLGGFYERPELAIDGKGRLWVAYRHYYVPWLGVERKITHVQQDWGIYARCFDGKNWSKLFRCSIGQGDGMQRLSIASLEDGIALAYTTGRTDRRPDTSHAGIVTASIHLAGTLSEEPSNRLHCFISRYIDPLFDTADPAKPEYQVFFGDLHRHTDLSLCDVTTDGTMDDAYRFAIDVAHLDFMGITDHSRDIAEGDAKSLLWWRCRKEVSRHDLSPNFIPMYAYEHSRGGEDHNVISLRPVLWPDTTPFPELWKKMDNDTFTIPHQTVCKPVPPSGEMPLGIDLKTWDYRDDAHRPLFEIYQACRDRVVERDANAGLLKGHIFGFIASSDHHSTNASFAGVWAKEKTREAIFRAMQARRTFGATDRIRLKVSMGNHWMGEKIKASEIAPIRVEADGTASMEGIDLIIDGQTRPNVARVDGDKVDTQITLPKLTGNGVHYFYVRLRQADGNQAWSSPIWIESEK